MHNILPGRRAHWVNSENINKSDLDGLSRTSFCQSRAVCLTLTTSYLQVNKRFKFMIFRFMPGTCPYAKLIFVMKESSGQRLADLIGNFFSCVKHPRKLKSVEVRRGSDSP